MILEDGFEELDESSLLTINGGACTGSSSSGSSYSGGCTGYSGGSSSTLYSGSCTGESPSSGNVYSSTDTTNSTSSSSENLQIEKDSSYDWRKAFKDPADGFYDNAGVDPGTVKGFGDRITKERSDWERDFTIDIVNSGDFYMGVTHSAYNYGYITTYSLYATGDNKTKITYTDTNNDGVIDYEK